ncbi:MAG TPA: ATP-binding cassette domain-containing protein [Streptosporangiaceae bacterium]|nr:ATP-binding cassette domain-containing protein [Streptosporangiaceae bacterium]
MDIRLAGVTVDFAAHGVRALDDVELSIAEGEQVALLGPSGAGKSTLLRIILGAIQPVAGEVRVSGLDPFGGSRDVTRIRRATGMVRQRDDLVRGLTARTNILIGHTHGWRPGDWWHVLRGRVPHRHLQRLHTLAVRHDIAQLLSTRIENLSGGQRQRVALVRALLGKPRLLLADEATSGLDPARAAEALAHLRDADAATLIVTTHDLTVARQFPRVVAVRDGRIVFDGPELPEEAVADIYGGRPAKVNS